MLKVREGGKARDLRSGSRDRHRRHPGQQGEYGRRAGNTEMQKRIMQYL